TTVPYTLSLHDALPIYAEVARRIGKTPVWIFHGDADPAVPVEESRKMVEALRAANANMKYSEYPGVGHNSWDKAYAAPEFIPWRSEEHTSELQSRGHLV